MENIHIFTDSLTTLPQDMINQLNIGIAPVYVVFGNTQIYRHTEEISTDEIFRLAMKKGRLPGIAAPTAEDLIRLFKPCIAAKHQILFISMSAEISASYKNAEAAANHFPKGQVTVMDSSRFASGTALIILQAVKLASRKKSIITLVSELQKIQKRVKEEWFLDKLPAGGLTANIYGLPDRVLSPLKLKTQLDIRMGNVNRKFEAERLNHHSKMDSSQIVISHTMARDSAEYVKNQLNERYGYHTIISDTNINGLLCRSSPKGVGISYLLRSEQGVN